MDDTETQPLNPHGSAEAPQTAPERLRAYEDGIFGKDAVRIRGQVERGYGSKFKVMPADHARHHAALEKLVLTEQALADAEAALLAAKASHETAVSEAAASAPGPTITEYVAAGYKASNYPPHGYASRSTPEEIAAAIESEKTHGGA